MAGDRIEGGLVPQHRLPEEFLQAASSLQPYPEGSLSPLLLWASLNRYAVICIYPTHVPLLCALSANVVAFPIPVAHFGRLHK
jgi:hypothetical protein